LHQSTDWLEGPFSEIIFSLLNHASCYYCCDIISTNIELKEVIEMYGALLVLLLLLMCAETLD